jgi:hypothetical protein
MALIASINEFYSSVKTLGISNFNESEGIFQNHGEIIKQLIKCVNDTTHNEKVEKSLACLDFVVGALSVEDENLSTFIYLCSLYEGKENSPEFKRIVQQVFEKFFLTYKYAKADGLFTWWDLKWNMMDDDFRINFLNTHTVPADTILELWDCSSESVRRALFPGLFPLSRNVALTFSKKVGFYELLHFGSIEQISQGFSSSPFRFIESSMQSSLIDVEPPFVGMTADRLNQVVSVLLPILKRETQAMPDYVALPYYGIFLEAYIWLKLNPENKRQLIDNFIEALQHDVEGGNIQKQVMLAMIRNLALLDHNIADIRKILTIYPYFVLTNTAMSEHETFLSCFALGQETLENFKQSLQKLGETFTTKNAFYEFVFTTKSGETNFALLAIESGNPAILQEVLKMASGCRHFWQRSLLLYSTSAKTYSEPYAFEQRKQLLCEKLNITSEQLEKSLERFKVLQQRKQTTADKLEQSQLIQLLQLRGDDILSVGLGGDSSASWLLQAIKWLLDAHKIPNGVERMVSSPKTAFELAYAASFKFDTVSNAAKLDVKLFREFCTIILKEVGKSAFVAMRDSALKALGVQLSNKAELEFLNSPEILEQLRENGARFFGVAASSTPRQQQLGGAGTPELGGAGTPARTNRQ